MKIKIFLLLLFLYTPHVYGASVILEPQENTVGPNTPFKIGIGLDSSELVNTIYAVIDIPYSFEVVDVSDGNSIVNFWIERPHLNDNHQLVFSGIIPGGFIGIHGRLLTLTIKALTEGEFVVGIDPESYIYENSPNPIKESLEANYLNMSVVEGKDNIKINIPDFDVPEPFTPLLSGIQTPGSNKVLYYVVFQAQDKGSGINRYQITESYRDIDLNDRNKLVSLKWKAAESPYLLRDQDLTSFIYIKAIDDTGNFRIEKLYPKYNRNWNLEVYYYIILILLVLIAILMTSRYRKV